jgi:hypothetical protein
VTLTLADVDGIAIGEYYKALQIDDTEVILTENGIENDTLTVKQDIIRGATET